MRKLGYIQPFDDFILNGVTVKGIEAFNLYGENRKYSWHRPDGDQRDLYTWLIEHELIVDSKDTDPTGLPIFNICHISPNIFSLEAFFGDYNNALETLDEQQVHVAGIWFNVTSKHESIRDLFGMYEDNLITTDQFMKGFAPFYEEYRPLSI